MSRIRIMKGELMYMDLPLEVLLSSIQMKYDSKIIPPFPFELITILNNGREEKMLIEYIE